jgi:hypothetical protein
MVEVEVRTDLHPSGRVVVADDRLERFEATLAAKDRESPQRLVYAAAHVVMQESYWDVDHSIQRPGSAAEVHEHIDWDTTMRFRRHLDDLGFSVAEAMDTAQRFSLGWIGARKLIEECGAMRLANGFVAGAGTDHLDDVPDVKTLVDGVVYQASLIRAAGGEVILLPMQQLTKWEADTDTYVDVYRSIIDQVEGPIYVHWLGEMFLAELAGYFPGDSFLRVMRLDPEKVRGAKLSLLDAEREVELRRHLLAEDQIMLTGDDFNFSSLIEGDGESTGSATIGRRDVPIGAFSHALLGIFDGIARPASVALQCLARGDKQDYREIMEPCQDLSRVVFCEPTCFYRSGLAFLAWLDGHQDNSMLVNHEEAARDAAHYVRVAELASRCGVFRDANVAVDRLREFLDRVNP